MLAGIFLSTNSHVSIQRSGFLNRKTDYHPELVVIGSVDFSQVEIAFVFTGLPHGEGKRCGSYTAFNNNGCGVDLHQTAHLVTLASVENRSGSCTRDDC